MTTEPRISTEKFHLQDVHVWMRHAEGQHQELLKRAEELSDDDPGLEEIERTLANTRDMQWNLTVRGLAQAACAGLWMAKYLLSPQPNGELIVPNGTFDTGYTSPFNRAEQTVGLALLAAEKYLERSPIQMVGDEPRIPIDLRLREINLGDATAMTKRAYRQRHPDNIERRKVDPLFTAYQNGSTIPEHMDTVTRGMHTTLSRDAKKGSRSALLSTHGRTVRAAILAIRRDHPEDFARIDRDEVIDNTTMFITRRNRALGAVGITGFNQFALVTPWREENGTIVLNDMPPEFIDFKAPVSRSYGALLSGLPHEVIDNALAERPQL